MPVKARKFQWQAARLVADRPRLRRKPVQHEREKVQKPAAAFCQKALPDGCGVFWTSINHGVGGRGIGGVLKGMGVRAGVPDWIALWRGRFYAVEFKWDDAELSDAQRGVHVLILAAGGDVAVCRSAYEFYLTLLAWGFPLQASMLENGVIVLRRHAALDFSPTQPKRGSRCRTTA